jgi:peptide chain release factor subunit 1
MDGNGTL